MSDGVIRIEMPFSGNKKLEYVDNVIQAVDYIKNFRKDFPIHFHEQTSSIHIGKELSPIILILFLEKWNAPVNNEEVRIVCRDIFQSFLRSQYKVMLTNDYLSASAAVISLKKMLNMDDHDVEWYTDNLMTNRLIKHLLRRDSLIPMFSKFPIDTTERLFMM